MTKVNENTRLCDVELGTYGAVAQEETAEVRPARQNVCKKVTAFVLGLLLLAGGGSLLLNRYACETTVCALPGKGCVCLTPVQQQQYSNGTLSCDHNVCDLPDRP